jgi:hypothetical protein
VTDRTTSPVATMFPAASNVIAYSSAPRNRGAQRGGTADLRASIQTAKAATSAIAASATTPVPTAELHLPSMNRDLAVLVGIAACGGQIAASTDVGSSGADATSETVGSGGSSGEWGVAPATARAVQSTQAPPMSSPPTPPVDAASGPKVGTPACQDVPCVLCDDGNYHCHSAVFPVCPGGISANSDCTPYDIPSYGCFSCPSDGNGNLWQCMRDGKWRLSLFFCSP